MVQRGQFLERPVVIRSGKLYLEGLWHRGERSPGVLICPPHPRVGASMDSPVCAELAFALARRGHPTLRFNYRGAGASQGELSDEASCLVDAKAALKQLRDSVEGGVAVAGYDFGARVALELARTAKGLDGLVLVAPVTGSFDFALLEKVQAEALVVVADRDPQSDREFLAGLCQKTGDRLEVIAEADHLFSRGLSQLGRLVATHVAGEPEDAPEEPPRSARELAEDADHDADD